MRPCINRYSPLAETWSGRPDLNRRPSAPKADALPDCATPRRQDLWRGCLPVQRAARKRNFQVVRWAMFDRTPEEGLPGPGRAPSINVLGGALQPCSLEPQTGFYRDPCRNTGPEYGGLATVCVVVGPECIAL